MGEENQEKPRKMPLASFFAGIFMGMLLTASSVSFLGGGYSERGTPLNFFDLKDGEIYYKIDDWPIVLLKGGDDKDEYRAYYVESNPSDIPEIFIVKKTETNYKIIPVSENALP
ncbi:hypothetical protein KKF19_03675 [Patescibacteria group bacterium]|nr:hypothetical protein [Patescibacteria group bacterium]